MTRFDEVARMQEIATDAPLAAPFCLWEEYQRTGEYRDMMRWLKHRAYCYAVVQPEGYP